MGATAVLETRELGVEPGAEAVARLRVQNTGQVVDQFTFEVLGEPATWMTVEPPSLSLFPGKEEVATVHFQPPRLPSTPAGALPFGVRVLSREDPAGTVVEEGLVVVGGFADTDTEFVPRTSRGRLSATHELALDNRGNVPLRAELTATDPERTLRFGFRPETLVVAPGRAAYARVRVRPRRRFLNGPPRSHPFQVLVHPDGGPPIPIDGSMVQEALLAAWMRTAALAALAAIAAGVLLWFTALRPAVQSAARDAVAGPLATQGAQIAALQRQPPGGGGSGGGAGGTQASPPPVTAATTPPSFARRLTAGAAQYQVPAGTQLLITDLVFQNPQGEHGVVQLQRNGVPLLVENLDNFRDLDYHFVTPITANASQTISMNAQCTPNACSNVAIYLNGYQKT